MKLNLRLTTTAVALVALGSMVCPASTMAAGENTGFFSKQRSFEIFGEKVADETVDQRDGSAVDKASARRVGRQIERLAQIVGSVDDDPISPAEVEGALDAAFAPLVPVVSTATADPPLEPLATTDHCAVVRAQPDTGPWGLMGALGTTTFTWVDGVGKLRTVTYRMADGGRVMTMSISMGGRLRAIETYHLTAPGKASYVSPDGDKGEFTLGKDSFVFSAEHESGAFSLDGECNLVVHGALRHNPRQIDDIFYNTTQVPYPAVTKAIEERSARRIARLRKDAIVGLARHS